MNIAQFLMQHKPDSGIPKRTLSRLLAHRTGISEAAVLAERERTLSKEVEVGLIKDLADLEAGKPEAYVFGDIPFLDWDFLIDARAMIPRPETEALCRAIIDGYRGLPKPRHILDLCCGSGVLGLCLALAFEDAHACLTDCSPEALALCSQNVARHHLSARVSLRVGDLWAAVPPGECYDLVVANPPYVAEGEEVQDSVLDHEPHQALFSDDEGMAHIKQILRLLPGRLLPGGRAAFELGHRHQERLAPWLERRFPSKHFHWERDPFGVPRFLFYDGVCGKRKERTSING